MRVLFVSAWFPYPPDNGSRIRVYNLIKALSKNHDVHLISLLQEDSDPTDADKLVDICKVVLTHKSRWFAPGTLKSVIGYFSSRPRSFVDTYDSDVRRSVEEAIKTLHPDVVIASTTGAVEYVPSNCGCATVLEEHNCEFAAMKRSVKMIRNPLKRLLGELGWRKYARWEAAQCRRFDRVVMVSEKDKDTMFAWVPGLTEMAVVPNGVDIGINDPLMWDPVLDQLVYNGALTFGANLDAVNWYVREIYPLLAEAGVTAKLTVTGRYGGVDVSSISSCNGVQMAGYVRDIRDVLYKSAACVVSLRHGGGSRLKILEAMAAGVPVVSTSVGAEGISAHDGEHLLIANTPEEFVTCIRSILSDRELVERLRLSARRLVEEQYSWAALGEQFVGIVEEAVAQRKICHNT